MPNIQILPSIPSFGEKLGQTIAESTGQIANAFQQRDQQKKFDSFRNILNDPTSTAVQISSALTGLAPKDQHAIGSHISGILREKQKQEAEQTSLNKALNLGNGSSRNTVQQSTNDNMFGPPSTSPAGNQSSPGQLTPEATQQRQGLPIGQETAAQPGLTGKQAFNPLDVNTYSKEQLRNVAGTKTPQGEAAKALLQEQKTQEQAQSKERQFAHKETAQYYNDLRAASEDAQKIKGAANKVRAAIKTGKTGASLKNFAISTFEKSDNPFLSSVGKAIKTKEAQDITNAQKSFASGFRPLFGARPTQAEFFWFENLLPDLLKAPEVNEASLQYFEKAGDIASRKYDVAQQIIKENNGYRPLDIEQQVNARLKPYADEIVKQGFELHGGRLNIADQNGQIVGTIEASQAQDIPEGYSIQGFVNQ